MSSLQGAEVYRNLYELIVPIYTTNNNLRLMQKLNDLVAAINNYKQRLIVQLINIEWIPTESASIRRIAYNAAESYLYVQFKSSDLIYVYYDVPKDIWHGLLGTKSKGSYLDRNIKDRFQFVTTKV
jgi:hypothetical protein